MRLRDAIAHCLALENNGFQQVPWLPVAPAVGLQDADSGDNNIAPRGSHLSTDRKRAALIARAVEGAADIGLLAGRTHAAEAERRFAQLADNCSKGGLNPSDIQLAAWSGYVGVAVGAMAAIIGFDATEEVLRSLIEQNREAAMDAAEKEPREH